jgi:RNA polymerase sigma-70 factor (ECF subfamily)
MEQRAGLTERSDESLMALWLDGHDAAFTVLIRRYEKPLFNFLRRMAGDASDAEDLFQEAFLRVHQYRRRYRAGAPFKPWLYCIAANLCRDRLRYRTRRPSVSLEAPLGETGSNLGDQIPARGEATDSPARRAETEARLEAALAALPVKHRTVFLMARYEEMPYDAIAGALKIPVGTVKSRMNKAVKCLMESMHHDT